MAITTTTLQTAIQPLINATTGSWKLPTTQLTAAVAYAAMNPDNAKNDQLALLDAQIYIYEWISQNALAYGKGYSFGRDNVTTDPGEGVVQFGQLCDIYIRRTKDKYDSLWRRLKKAGVLGLGKVDALQIIKR